MITSVRFLKRRRLHLLPWLCLGLLSAACSVDRQEPVYDNPYDPAQGTGVSVPDSVRVAVGDAVVRLTWRMPNGESADEYNVLRRAPGMPSEEEERVLSKVQSPEYRDTRVRNGQTYIYRVSASRNGRLSRRTEEIEARPGIHSIVLADDRPLTKDRLITVGYNAPSAVAVRCTEDAAHFDRPWNATSGQLQWQLSADDGLKTVYAEFRFEDGSISLATSDTITLDTKAAIHAVTFDGPTTRRPGDTVHFRIIAGETRGTATISVDSILDNVSLYDDGTGGDPTAGDGTYEGDRVLSSKEPVTRAQVHGSFTDEAGNTATSVAASQLLTVRPALKPVTLTGADLAEPPAAASVTLHWSLFDETGFSAYRLFRGETAAVDSTGRLVATVQSASTLEGQDTQVVEGRRYYYRVYVQDTAGSEAGSNVLDIRIPNLRNPAAVTIESGSATGPTRIAIQWGRSSETDFQSYRLYGSDEGAVDETDPLLLEATDAGRTLFVQTDLIENTAHHYRVYVVDEGGLRTPSNEVEVFTKNEAPPAVSLNEATQVDTTAATLSWSASDAHDFARYGLYRDEVATVTTGSTKVVEIDEKSSTTFRDRELEKGKRYYYRVFVFDDATEAKSTGSNTVSIQTSP